MELTVDSVGKYLKSDKPIEPLVHQLRAEPDKADAILEAFVSSSSFHRRSWAVWAAPQLLPHDRAVALARLNRVAGCRSAPAATDNDGAPAAGLTPELDRRLPSDPDSSRRPSKCAAAS